MTSFSPSTVYQSTSEIVGQLKLEKSLFQDEMSAFPKSFDHSDDVQYFILSNLFIQQWKSFTDTFLSHVEGQEVTAESPKPMNEDLILQYLTDFNEFDLKKDIQEGVHYTFVNRAIMQLFQAYEGPRIIRRAYYHGPLKNVQVHPIKFDFVYISPSWIRHLKENPNTPLPLLKSLAYKNETILDLLYRLVQFSKNDPRNKAEKYLNYCGAKFYASENFDPIQYGKIIQEDLKDYKILTAPGKEVKKNLMIGELIIPTEKPIMIVELQEQTFVFKEEVSSGDVYRQRCQFCRKLAILQFPCKCGQVSYCSNSCKERDWRYHERSCEAKFDEENKQAIFSFKEDSKRGVVGLGNVGNTCYMNSALQCMQHTRGLTQYFVDMCYKNEINEDNPIGSKGKLIKAYVSFLESTMTTDQNVVIPSRLKWTIGKVKEMFSGYEQQDSQEFLLFMLDTLHEDLNRVIKKPYTQGVDSQGRPDSIVAKESWICYLKRNQSIVNDLMGGQYRSEVKCPDCHNISVTFDPFLIFTVPIPSIEAKKLNLYCFFANYNRESYKFTVTSRNNIAQDILDDVSTKAKVPKETLKLYILGFNGIIRQVDGNQTFDRLINEKQLDQGGQERQLFVLEFLPSELENIEKKKQLVFKWSKKDSRSSSGKQALTFKRPFLFYPENLKGQNLYDRACEFIVNLESSSYHHMAKLSNQSLVLKLAALKQKVIKEKFFQIEMSFGNKKQIKHKIYYENKTLIELDTNITELLEANNDQVEFEVLFESNPLLNFNSYKSFRQNDDDGYFSFDTYGYSHGEEDKYTLYECLNEMKKPEQLVEGNEVFCSICEDLKLAEKKMEMYKASKYLILQLRRFKQVGYEKTKNYAQIDFPLQLDLAKDIIDPTQPSAYLENLSPEQQAFIFKPDYWNIDKNSKTTFHLYGVINHHGNLGGGHYTAYAKSNDTWYLFDDGRVEEIIPEKMNKKAAYLLFYERQE